MSNKGLTYWNGLPTWAKGVIAVGGLAIGYFAVKGFLNKLKSDAEKQDAVVTQQTQEQELENLQNNGVQRSFAISQYKQWADEIQNQFDGCDVSLSVAWLSKYMMSTSGAKLGDIIMKFKNDADFLALNTAWGSSRTYDQCGFFTGNFTGNLSQAVTDELTLNEIKVINEQLAKQGITYRF
jgi:hypothetical protein